MNRLTIGIMGAALAAAVACGGDSGTGPATSRNNAGTGSGTLRVIADIDAKNVPGGFTTDYDVTVRDGLGNRVTGATVTISNNSLGTLTLTETSVGSGNYFATRLSFPDGDFRLSVVRATDNVQGVVLGGPGVHTITSPANGSVAAANQPLTVRWSVPSRAKATEVETNNFGPIALPDTGAYSIAGPNNPANSSQQVRVSRYNEVEIAGGQPGSRLRVTVENNAQPVNVR